jgi:hypothetical protein
LKVVVNAYLVREASVYPMIGCGKPQTHLQGRSQRSDPGSPQRGERFRGRPEEIQTGPPLPQVVKKPILLFRRKARRIRQDNDLEMIQISPRTGNGAGFAVNLPTIFQIIPKRAAESAILTRQE